MQRWTVDTDCSFVVKGCVHKYEASLWTLENREKILILLQSDHFQCYSLRNFREHVCYRYISAKFVKNKKYCSIAEKR